MNIGFDAKRFFLNNTGLGNYSRDLIKGILEENSSNNYFLFTPTEESNSRTNFIKDYKNVEVVGPKNLYKRFKSYWRSVRLESVLKKYDIQVYHGLSHEIPKNNSFTKIKYVVTIHDLIFIRYPENYSIFDRKLYTQKVKYACKNADVIIAISEQTKRDLIEFLAVPEKKIKVVYQTCSDIFDIKADYRVQNIVKKKYNLPNKYVLSVGTIEKRKNLELVIRAMDKMHTDIPLVVVGKKTIYFQEIEREIEKHGLKKKVIFLENVEFIELPELYESASLFVYASVFEGFGIPVLEALYSRTPVIAAKGSCLEEVGGPNSIYVDPHDYLKLAIQMDKVLKNELLQQEMKEKGYEYAKNFSTIKQAKEVLKIYEGLF
jgi:glycosyltransferase involved in cell wall biosynthesis